jgi:citrate lyase beta subunit
MMRFLISGLGLLCAVDLAAQSVPPITRTREVAGKAVAAANARTASSSTLAPDSQKVAPRPVEQPPALATATDSATGSTSVKAAGAAFEREAYLYDRGARRDPFVSLMATGELRPLISDLRLVAVAYDANGRNSVAVVHDISSKDKVQYRLRAGQSVGRMRVASIAPRSVVFTIEEFGYSRQETLALGDSNKERKQ